MGRIRLKGLEFQAKHGVYESERVSGNVFTVDVAFDYDFSQAAKKDDLALTVDYELIYAIVAEIMSGSARLLEHLAHKIGETLKDNFPEIKNIEVCVAKHNPPIHGKCGRAEVVVRIP